MDNLKDRNNTRGGYGYRHSPTNEHEPEFREGGGTRRIKYSRELIPPSAAAVAAENLHRHDCCCGNNDVHADL